MPKAKEWSFNPDASWQARLAKYESTIRRVAQKFCATDEALWEDCCQEARMALATIRVEDIEIANRPGISEAQREESIDGFCGIIIRNSILSYLNSYNTGPWHTGRNGTRTNRKTGEKLAYRYPPRFSSLDHLTEEFGLEIDDRHNVTWTGSTDGLDEDIGDGDDKERESLAEVLGYEAEETTPVRSRPDCGTAEKAKRGCQCGPCQRALAAAPKKRKKKRTAQRPPTKIDGSVRLGPKLQPSEPPASLITISKREDANGSRVTEQGDALNARAIGEETPMANTESENVQPPETKVRKPGKTVRHGTKSRYRAGCSCNECKAAVAEYNRVRRHRRREELNKLRQQVGEASAQPAVSQSETVSEPAPVPGVVTVCQPDSVAPTVREGLRIIRAALKHKWVSKLPKRCECCGSLKWNANKAA